MNDLGVTLLWGMVRATVLLAPAVVLHLAASRRGPAAGAWVAGLGLALAALLSLGGLAAGRPREAVPRSAATVAASAEIAPTFMETPSSRAEAPTVGVDLSRLRAAWTRLERGAAAPAERGRPWGRVAAVVLLAGTAVGLLRLALGLGAVAHCRRRATPVDDPALCGLIEGLCEQMQITSPISLVEAADLTTPATAGWRRPVVLLPPGWRSWSEAERRAVLAHELAHVKRGDYATGLAARLAVALNVFHPMVRWLAGRLQLQQEQAADALGARFAGGRATYLLALSRLALEQDGRSRGWPARAFLPRRGTLIRRIAMLRREMDCSCDESPKFRLGTLFALLAAATAAAGLRGPTLASDEAPAPARIVSPALNEPIRPVYVPEGMTGFVAFRPAAAFRREGMRPFAARIAEFVSQAVPQIGLDPSKPGLRKLGCEDIEWVACGVAFDATEDPDGNKLHRMMLGGLTIRTTAPFDWAAFFRSLGGECEEARESGRVYYRITGKIAPMILGPKPGGFCQVDDRTAVFAEEAAIRKLLDGSYALPAFLKTADWQNASRGLLAVALDNEKDALLKAYDLDRPDDKLVVPFFKDVDLWCLSVADADLITLDARARCRTPDAASALARVASSSRTLALTISKPGPSDEGPDVHRRALAMFRSFAAHLDVTPYGSTVAFHSVGFGTLADLATLLQAEAEEESRDRGGSPAAARP